MSPSMKCTLMIGLSKSIMFLTNTNNNIEAI